ncbi:MAG: hypothetical protein HY319_19945 [Armatimonadetes bacterium]|nr:hypothetical protein [Armatimonadota bacterium]
MKRFLRLLGLSASGAVLGFVIFMAAATWSSQGLKDNQLPGPAGLAGLAQVGIGAGALAGLLAGVLAPRRGEG